MLLSNLGAKLYSIYQLSKSQIVSVQFDILPYTYEGTGGTDSGTDLIIEIRDGQELVGNLQRRVGVWNVDKTRTFTVPLRDEVKIERCEYMAYKIYTENLAAKNKRDDRVRGQVTIYFKTSNQKYQVGNGEEFDSGSPKEKVNEYSLNSAKCDFQNSLP